LTTDVGSRQPLLIVETVPERLFRVARVSQADQVVSNSMPTGAWVERGDGLVPAGSLGVLVDNVLGYAVLLERPLDHWSVSSEISIDLCAPIESGSTLFGRARPVHSDARGAVTSGEVVDDRGRLVAVCRQHGRYASHLPALDDVHGETPIPLVDRAAPNSVYDLLGAKPVPTDASAVLDLTATPFLVNPLGNVHGGITLCAADLTAVAAVEAHGREMSTASIHVSYVRPMPLGSVVTFHAKVLHSGRTFAVALVDARTADGKLCATATVTATAR
jgi:uncharacterized protein (TIGR00369 family)